jgi:hypothetical protein
MMLYLIFASLENTRRVSRSAGELAPPFLVDNLGFSLQRFDAYRVCGAESVVCEAQQVLQCHHSTVRTDRMCSHECETYRRVNILYAKFRLKVIVWNFAYKIRPITLFLLTFCMQNSAIFFGLSRQKQGKKN